MTFKEVTLDTFELRGALVVGRCEAISQDGREHDNEAACEFKSSLQVIVGIIKMKN
jgi:hypothetical protein